MHFSRHLSYLWSIYDLDPTLSHMDDPHGLALGDKYLIISQKCGIFHNDSQT